LSKDVWICSAYLFLLPDIQSLIRIYFSRELPRRTNCRDVFSTTELKNDVIANYADVTEDDGSIVRVWREPLSTKYSKLQGIRSLHDFVFSKHCLTDEVVPRARAQCYTGPFSPASIHILARKDRSSDIIPDEEQTYTKLNRNRALSESKMAHLKQMYRNFVPSGRWLPFLN
jgi:hypothetical protein